MAVLPCRTPHIGNVHKYARPEEVPEHTVFIITTDGMENASHRYSSAEIREKIKRQTEKYSWEFIFRHGAVAGGLAGALYGGSDIPREWLSTLMRKDYITDLCDRATSAWMQN